MLQLIFSLYILIMIGGTVRWDARRKGIPLLHYIGACLLVIGAAVSGIFPAVYALDHLRSGATAAFFLILASGVALSIWLCIFLFTRLVRKSDKESGSAP